MQLATLIIAALALVLTLVTMVLQLVTLAVVFSKPSKQQSQETPPEDRDDEPTDAQIQAFFSGEPVPPKTSPSPTTVISQKEKREVEEALTNTPFTGIDEDFGL